jgi:hypothetical protein
MSGSLSNERTQLTNFLLGANSSNPANQLSAQMAALWLNVRHGTAAGSYGDTQLCGVSSSAVIYDPALAAYAARLGSALYGGGFITVGNILTATNTELGLYYQTTSSTSPGYMAPNGFDYNYENELQNAISRANQNQDFVI